MLILNLIFRYFVEAPPEVFDNRTLYDKLKEQHEIKKKEFEETYSLSQIKTINNLKSSIISYNDIDLIENQVRGVDSDEVQFLNEIDRARLEKEREIRLQERKELEEVKISFYFKIY